MFLNARLDGVDPTVVSLAAKSAKSCGFPTFSDIEPTRSLLPVLAEAIQAASAFFRDFQASQTLLSIVVFVTSHSPLKTI